MSPPAGCVFTGESDARRPLDEPVGDAVSFGLELSWMLPSAWNVRTSPRRTTNPVSVQRSRALTTTVRPAVPTGSALGDAAPAVDPSSLRDSTPSLLRSRPLKLTRDHCHSLRSMTPLRLVSRLAKRS